jgi:hypothetical protein
MLRNIIAFFVGLVVIYAGVFVAFAVTMVVMGPDRIFVPGSWQTSLTFVGITVALGFVAALAGGVATRLVTTHRSPAMVLGGFVLITGLISGVYGMTRERVEAPAREEGTTRDDLRTAQERGWVREPGWLAIANPFIGCAGVVIGSLIVPRGRRDAPLRAIPEVEPETSDAERRRPG